MPTAEKPTLAELRKLISQAKAEVARGRHEVEKAQKRQAKFKAKHAESKRDRERAEKDLRLALKHDRVRKAAQAKARVDFHQRRVTRNARKIKVWTRREADAISDARGAKKRLGVYVSQKRAMAPADAKKLTKWAESTLGTREGSNRQREWADRLGVPWTWPWCSTWIANGLVECGIVTKSQLPASAPYSGSWISWAHAHRVGLHQIEPGDIVIFDWGDGGMTDHVALYVGGGYVIGGNQSDNVTKVPLNRGAVVAVMRLDRD